MILTDFAATKAPYTLIVSKHYPVLPFGMHLYCILRTYLNTFPATGTVAVNKHGPSFQLSEERDPFLYKLKGDITVRSQRYPFKVLFYQR